MEKYVPDIYQSSIFTVSYESLKSRGIKCILFDLDNTLVPITEKLPSEEVKELFKKIKEMGFKIIIFSNSPKRRVKNFKNALNVDCLASANKPHAKKFLSVINLYGFKMSEVCIVGDSMIDDINGGNNVGITTVLVDRLGKKEFPFAKIKRLYESYLLRKLRMNNLFTKGRYYE